MPSARPRRSLVWLVGVIMPISLQALVWLVGVIMPISLLLVKF